MDRAAFLVSRGWRRYPHIASWWIHPRDILEFGIRPNCELFGTSRAFDIERLRLTHEP